MNALSSAFPVPATVLTQAISRSAVQAALQAEANLPTGTVLDLDSYSTFIVTFSGGKDSLACVLLLLELGVPRERIELWHHDVDGREGSELMDWPVTRDYCRRVAEALGIKIYFSWKQGGFEREMLRKDSLTAPISFEIPGGEVVSTGGTRGEPSTRRKFPQVSADLSVRWCSAYLKIDVGASAIRNQDRFDRRRTLVLSGERGEESTARSKYLMLEADRSDPRAVKGKKPAKGNGRAPIRHVDRWRPILRWKEQQVWEIIERWGINPHPAYRLGWGRVSCMTCIFGSPNQWASVKALGERAQALNASTGRELATQSFEKVAGYEEEFGVTIQRKKSVRHLAVVGQPYRMSDDDIIAALSRSFDEPIILPPGTWKLPAGAYGESCGPT